ncbi:TetR/AcrR family transcriptional regulator [Curtobacterium sp. PhB115]|uniref:TetR/AcrR family transcriptional regulator n=1 Tax=Curtobacterium sp. PhB115 TaxID=2485173 RepID=UPI000F4B8DDE|nr:TetR/AcrR family transcriptional regulator [Curtobacterium sp. PhB115]ROP74552.1 TetR family transcriptional regulator [Curtobacterium sp. PhB115]
MAQTARALARQTVTADILAAARARLTEEGPSQLSLRAVARDVGMVSSAVYRYFPSRDDLLTALLIADYDELGRAVEDADTDAGPEPGARWVAVCRAIRTWSVAHPGDFALLYGSPVPGYAAPRETVEPATRTTFALVRVVADACAVTCAGACADACAVASDDGSDGRPGSPSAGTPGPAAVASTAPAVASGAQSVASGGQSVAPGGQSVASGGAAAVAAAVSTLAELGIVLPDEVVVRTLMAWSTVFGTISFELFGHFVGSVSDPAAYFDQVIARLADDLGFTAVL